MGIAEMPIGAQNALDGAAGLHAAVELTDGLFVVLAENTRAHHRLVPDIMGQAGKLESGSWVQAGRSGYRRIVNRAGYTAPSSYWRETRRSLV